MQVCWRPCCYSRHASVFMKVQLCDYLSLSCFSPHEWKTVSIQQLQFFLFFFFKRPSRPACLTGQNPVRESEREGADSPLEAWQQPTPSKSLQTSTSLLLLLWASLVFSSFFFLAVKWGEIWQMISFTMSATYFFSFICNHRALLPFFPWLFLWPTSVRKVQTRSDEKATFTVGFIPS